MNDLRTEYMKLTKKPYLEDEYNPTWQYVEWLENKVKIEHEKLVEQISYCQFKCENI
jgi:hypothetical protein